MNVTNRDVINVGIAGLGRSGWGIHANTAEALSDRYRVAAVMDVDAARREEAQTRFKCRAYESFGDLARDGDVDLLVVATPSTFHTDHAIDAMRAGRHVLVEKPFALSTGDAERMMVAAADHGRLLAPFQNRRYESHFLKVHEVLASGVLGRVHLIRIAWHGFGRRWDWQTLSSSGGGLLNNLGSHAVDQALQLVGPHDVTIWTDRRNVLSSGDAEDHAKIVLQTDGGPVVDVEVTSASAYGQERWFIMGSSGGLRGTTTHLDWKWVDWSGFRDRPVDASPSKDRSYNREDLEWSQASWDGSDDFALTARHFYEDLYAAIQGNGPLKVTPESAKRLVSTLEACHRSAVI